MLTNLFAASPLSLLWVEDERIIPDRSLDRYVTDLGLCEDILCWHYAVKVEMKCGNSLGICAPISIWVAIAPKRENIAEKRHFNLETP